MRGRREKLGRVMFMCRVGERRVFVPSINRSCALSFLSLFVVARRSDEEAQGINWKGNWRYGCGEKVSRNVAPGSAKYPKREGEEEGSTSAGGKSTSTSRISSCSFAHVRCLPRITNSMNVVTLDIHYAIKTCSLPGLQSAGPRTPRSTTPVMGKDPRLFS